MFGGNSVVYLAILQEFVRCFDEKELKDAFDNDLLENTPAFCQSHLTRWTIDLGFRIHWRQKGRRHEIG